MPDIDPKNIEAVAKALKLTNEQAEKAIKHFTKLSKIDFKGTVKSLKDFSKYSEDGVQKVKELSSKVADLHKKGMPTDEAVKLNRKLQNAKVTMTNLSKIKPTNPKDWKQWQKDAINIQKSIDKIEDEIKEAELATKSFGDAMEEAGPSFMKKMIGRQKGISKEIGGWSTMFKRAGTSMGKMPGLLKMTGKAAKGLGGILGGVSKAFLGWPGLIMMAVKKIWDIGMEADQFVKDANKAFARLRGPDITADVKKQFKEFNDQIFKTGDNLRTGLDVTQIRSLMESMVQAGYNITQLNKGLMSYRDAIYVSAKASKTLGMELPQVGSIIGKLFTDLRMNLDDIDKAFVQVGFDAKKSGLSTDRFWGAVANATAHLALYGVKIGAASKTMKRFTEDMVGGADDAEDAMTDMYDVFKSGSLSTQAALLDFAKQGGADLNKMINDMVMGFGKEARDLEAKISVEMGKGEKADVEQLKKLRAQLYAAQSKQERAQSLLGKTAVEQASEMGMFANEAPKLLMSAIKRIGGNLSEISGQRMLTVLESVNETLGINKKTARMLIEEAKVTSNLIGNLLSETSNSITENQKAFQENKHDIAKAIETVGKTEGDAQIRAMERLSSLLNESISLDAGLADVWGQIIQSDTANASKIAELIRQGDKKSLDDLSTLIGTAEMTHNLTANRFKEDEKIQKDLEKAAEDTFKGIVDQTLSYKEMIEIAKDEVKWRASSLGVFQALNKGVMNIFGWLTRNDEDYMSESAKAAQEQLKTSVLTNKKLSALLVIDKKTGNIVKGSQKELTSRLGKEMGVLQDKIAAQEKAVGISADPSDALNDLARAIEETKDVEEKKILEAQMKSLKDVVVLQSSFSNLLKGLQKGTVSPDDIKALGERVEKSALSKEEKAQYKGLVKELQDIGKGTDQKKIAATKAKIDKMNLDKTEKIRNDGNKRLGVFRNQLSELEIMERDMNELNKNNKVMLDYAKAKARADPEIMGQMADDLVNEIKLGASKEDLANSYSLEFLKDIQKTLEKEPGKTIPPTLTAAIEKATKYREKYLKGEGVAADESEAQGLKKPIKVTKPGPIVLHPGEEVLPKSFQGIKTEPTLPEAMSFKTEPAPLMPAMTGGAMAGGEGARGMPPIEINISADTKDLAKRIGEVAENACRKVIYDYHLPAP